MCLLLSIIFAVILPLGLQAQPVTSDKLRIAVEAGRLSASFENQPAGVVLDTLAGLSQVRIILADELAGQLVSAELKAVPLEEGIRRMLANFDCISYYGGPPGQSARLRTVWVYPRGGATAMRPIAPELWASGKEIAASLADSDPAVRERAYLALLDRPDSSSRELWLNALRGISERDEDLRQRLLQVALGKGSPVPVELLAQLARSDANEVIRWMALDGLASDAAAVKPVAQAALGDASEAVRERAQEILSPQGENASHQRQK